MNVLEQFEKIFNQHRDPDCETVTIERPPQLSTPTKIYTFAVHRYHPKLAICFERSPDESNCSIWLFGDGPRSWQRYEKFVDNENHEQILEILYKIGHYTGENSESHYYDDATSKNQPWTGGDWSACYQRAKAELNFELANFLHQNYLAEVEIAAKARVEATPPPEERFVPNLPSHLKSEILPIMVGQYPAGPTTYSFPDEEEMFRGSSKGSLTEGRGTISPFIPLSKDQAEVLGEPLANFISLLSDLGGIGNLFVVPRGVTVIPEEEQTLDHVKIGELLAKCFGYANFQLYNVLTKEKIGNQSLPAP